MSCLPAEVPRLVVDARKFETYTTGTGRTIKELFPLLRSTDEVVRSDRLHSGKLGTAELWVESWVRRLRAEMVLQPWMFGPLSAKQGRTLLGVYDLIPLSLGRAKAGAMQARLKSVGRRDEIHILTLADTTRDALSSDWELPWERIHVARPGVRFPNEPADAARPANEPYLLCVSRLSKHKGVGHLISAWEDAGRPYRLRLILPPGDAASRQGETIKRRGVVVQSSLSDQSLDSAMCSALAIVVPSLHEGYGLTFAEAVAAGRPVIAHALPAYSEFAVDGVTWVAAGSRSELAQAIERAASLQPAKWSAAPPTWDSWRSEVVSALVRTAQS